ncbi:EAL domain-containing protein [Persephonella sp.]
MELSQKELDRIEDIFVYFYKEALSDRYTSTFFYSPELIPQLVSKQTKLIADFIGSLNDKNRLKKVKSRYKHAFKLHWNLDIEENFMFESIDFIEKKLQMLIDEEELNLPVENVEALTKELKDQNAVAYIEGILEQLIFIWEGIVKNSPSLSDGVYEKHIGFYQDILKIIQGKKTERRISDFSSCSVGRYFYSVKFLVKSHPSRKLINFIIHFHKKIHTYAEIMVDYFLSGDYIKALRMARLMALNGYLFLILSIEIESKWLMDRENAFYQFISDPLFSDRIVSFFFINKSRRKLEKELFTKLSQELAHTINKVEPDRIFAYVEEEKQRLYIVIIEDSASFRKELMKKLVNRINNFLKNKQKKYNKETLKNLFKGAVIDVPYVLNNGISNRYLSLFFNNLQEVLEENQEFITYLSKTDILDRVVKETKEHFMYMKFFENLEDEKQLKLELFGQPIYNLKDGRQYYGVEILARLKNPEDNSIIPAFKFIEFAKHTGTTELFDLKVLSLLMDSLKNSKNIKSDRFFVNLFPSSYLSEKVINKIRELSKIAQEKNIEIVLELTEYENIGFDSLSMFNSLKNVYVAVDDFGTGSSNYDTLSKLSKEKKVKYLKIYGKFVKGLVEDDSYENTLKAILYTAKLLNKTTIFEFVESKETESKIKKLAKEINYSDILLGQGFYYAKPQPLSDFV